MPHTSPSPDTAATLQTLGVRVLVRGWLSANNLVFRAGQGQAGGTVVDTGYLSHAEQTHALIDSALGGTPLAEVVNTHLHSDHCGGNASLARRWPGLRISVPSGYRDSVLAWDEAKLSYRATDQQCDPFVAQRFLSHGDEVRLADHDWQVHSAPGHDPDAVMLFEPTTRTLISGDALWESRLAIIFPELADEPGFEATAWALDQIEALQPRLVLPGHGQPFAGVDQALLASRQRLASFVAAPHKHRQYATRALVTYHLLEHRSRPREALVRWIVSTPVFRQALRCETERALQLAEETVARLVQDGVLVQRGDQVAMPD
jgi:glyoxylase-like metal-dependent hydrolase (beta-lactamase superfamily II)